MLPANKGIPDDHETVLLVIESHASGRMTGNAQYRQLGFPELYDFPVYQIFPYRDAFRLHRQAERLGLLLGEGRPSTSALWASGLNP